MAMMRFTGREFPFEAGVQVTVRLAWLDRLRVLRGDPLQVAVVLRCRKNPHEYHGTTRTFFDLPNGKDQVLTKQSKINVERLAKARQQQLFPSAVARAQG